MPTDKILPRLSILIAHALFYLAIVGTAAGLAWACIAKISVVVTAAGHFAPIAEPVRLSVPEGGVISAVPVQVGAKVPAGASILELDSFRETAEVARVRHELDEARAEADGDRDDAKILEAAANNIRQELTSAQDVLALSTKQLEALDEAFRGGAVSLYVVQAKEAEMAQTRLQMAQLRADLDRAEADRRKNQSNALAGDEKVKELTIELARDVQAKRRTVLRAPVAGTVSYVSSLRPGRYLAANDVAATLVPRDEPLLAEVWIPNESMRRVRPSLRARMKLSAYPYPQFGVLSGTLISIDPDADAAGAYRAWIRPDRLTMEDSHGIEIVRTGLALTAEIEVDRRSVMSVLLDPFERMRQGLRVSQ